MKNRIVIFSWLVFTGLLLFVVQSNAQQKQSQPKAKSATSGTPSEQNQVPTSNIKALSDDVLGGYYYGSALDMARAAELNHYPNPEYVLQLETQLKITPAQRQILASIAGSTRGQAMQAGLSVIEMEAAIDSIFAMGKAKEYQANVSSLVNDISRVQGVLRFLHLNAHIETRDVLTSEQIALYEKLRFAKTFKPQPAANAATKR